MLWRLVRFAAGVIAGFAIWWSLATPYGALVVRGTEILLHLDKRYADANLLSRTDDVLVRSEHGLFPMATVPLTQLTYNVVLLMALFAASARPLSRRNVVAFALSLAVVLLSHPLSLFVAIHATYAVRAGPWGQEHYGELAATFWQLAEVFWRLVGMFALPFVLWWGLVEARSR